MAKTKPKGKPTKKARAKAAGTAPATAKLTRPRVPKRPKVEIDDPARRYGELFQDRMFGSAPAENLALLRKAALDASLAMGPLNETSLTPATPGGSNWVELGPTAIPNGQTYGGARVLVSGRVTEVVQHPTDPLTLYVAA